jgi:hypothetical protein
MAVSRFFIIGLSPAIRAGLFSGNWQSAKSTGGQTHFGQLLRNTKYYESIVFSYSRVRRLRWKRAGGACSHGETCGEEHRDNR